MLNVQHYLRQGNKGITGLEDLKNDLGIKYKLHEDQEKYPLVILNYCQIDSPKAHPIVMECRGLVLEVGTWNVVAKPFGRFFNYGEAPEITGKFDWSNFSSYQKEDGTLLIVYYYKDRWFVNTRQTFGDVEVECSGFTFEELFWKYLDVPGFITKYGTTTFCFELCSQYNKIVTEYKEPKLFLIYSYDHFYNNEVHYSELPSEFNIVKRHDFKTQKDVQDYIDHLEQNEHTTEGLVLQDCNGLRIKIKNPKYLALHRMKGNGNVFHTKNLLPFIKDNECDELLTYFPEVKNKVYQISAVLSVIAFQIVMKVMEVGGIQDQKEYALKVKDSDFSSIFFNLKRSGNFSSDNIHEEIKNWKGLVEYIDKKLLDKDFMSMIGFYQDLEGE